jgi:hypothetical protein
MFLLYFLIFGNNCSWLVVAASSSSVVTPTLSLLLNRLVPAATNKQRTNSVAFSPHVNYTDRGPPFVDEVSANFMRVKRVVWAAYRILTAVNLGFLARRQRINTKQCKACWIRRFPSCVCRVGGKLAINSSQDFLFQNKESRLNAI